MSDDRAKFKRLDAGAVVRPGRSESTSLLNNYSGNDPHGGTMIGDDTWAKFTWPAHTVEDARHLAGEDGRRTRDTYTIEAEVVNGALDVEFTVRERMPDGTPDCDQFGWKEVARFAVTTESLARCVAVALAVSGAELTGETE